MQPDRALLHHARTAVLGAQVALDLAVSLQALGDAGPASGLSGPNVGPEPQGRPRQAGKDPGRSRRRAPAVELGQARIQVVVDEHDGERRVVIALKPRVGERSARGLRVDGAEID